MYIREIHIKNIRGFDEVHLDLDRGGGKYAGWTVIAGPNGTGKSTLLRAVALSVAGPVVASKLERSFAGWVREGSPSGSVWTLLGWSADDTFQGVGRPPIGPIKSGLTWEMQPSDNGVSAGNEPKMAKHPELLNEGLTTYRGPWADNPKGWFIVGYGVYRRLGFRDDYEEPGPIMSARLHSLFDEDFTLAESIRWLKDILARSLDLRDRARKLKEKSPTANTDALDAEADTLERLHEVVLSLLDDGLLPPGDRIATFNTSGLWIERDGMTLPLRQLSDGYRAVIALVFDILRQMHRGPGELQVNMGKAPIVVPCEGVVFVDEMEAHLHPEWQKRIGFWLKEHFPNVQFIVTTHSPFICQAADPKGLIRLPAPGAGRKAEHVSEEDFRIIVNGGADDAALSTLFGLEHAHSDVSEDRKTRVAQLEARTIRGTASAEEKAELEELSAALPTTGMAVAERALRKHEAHPRYATGL